MAVCACNRQLVALSGCLDSFVRMKVSFDQKHKQLSINTLYNRQTTAKESAKADASFPLFSGLEARKFDPLYTPDCNVLHGHTNTHLPTGATAKPYNDQHSLGSRSRRGKAVGSRQATCSIQPEGAGAAEVSS